MFKCVLMDLTTVARRTIPATPMMTLRVPSLLDTRQSDVN